MGAAIVPNLDSIAEFRILTNNFDAEYGEFSGGQINVVTKSGTNEFHGDVFEFLRNTDLDARNYFSPTRGAFDQNQFGGTFGGPIRKNKIFFFARLSGDPIDPGHRYRRDSRSLRCRTETGNLSDLASSFVTTDANGNTIPTTVSGPYFGQPARRRSWVIHVSRGRAVLHARDAPARRACFPGAVIPAEALGPRRRPIC